MQTIQSQIGWNLLAFALGLTAAFSVAGCGAEKPAAIAGISSDKSAEHHDHEHDHLHDHGIPDHKPASFAEAAQQLARRQRLVIGEFKVGHLDHAQEAIQKLHDVIRWLPELAADTDLGEADWNAVQSLSRQMESAVQTWPTLQLKPSDQEVERLTGLIAQLKPLAEKTKLEHADWSESPPADASAAGSE